MQQANGNVNVGKTCMFTNTLDEHFVIDKHPEHEHIVIAAGFQDMAINFQVQSEKYYMN